MLITSHHSRVFDGITEARLRALAEPEEFCTFTTGSCTEHPAVALWVHAPSGKITPLCKDHMDAWLDNGDGAGDSDPPALVPLRNRRKP